MSLPRLLIDENLSIGLPVKAHRLGFECAHVAHAGFRTWNDWNLLLEVIEHDWVLVTNNAVEFRGRYRRLDLHPGVVFVLPNVPRASQIEIFQTVLEDIAEAPDLTNTALDVFYDGTEIVVRRYMLP